MSGKSENVRWHGGEVPAGKREEYYRQKGTCVWLTGLSGSGKSSVAYRVERQLLSGGHKAYVIDGDNLRHGLNGDLGFSPTDRKENIRRVGEVARLFVDAGLIVLASFVSPYREDRKAVRDSLEGGEFLEVYVDTPLHVCEARDPKGLYRRARAGEVRDFTGISAPYEAPEAAELVLHTDQHTLDQCAERVVEMLRDRGRLI